MKVMYLGSHNLLTVSAHIERRRSIKNQDFQSVHNGRFCPIFVYKYHNFGQKADKNDRGVPMLYPMAF